MDAMVDRLEAALHEHHEADDRKEDAEWVDVAEALPNMHPRQQM